MVILLTSFIYMDMGNYKIYSADDLLKWKKNDTMDASLQIIENKTGDDDILLEGLMSTAGNYSLEYYLDSGRRTTVTFQQQYDQLIVYYRVDEMVGGVTTNITQDLVDQTYLEMDYSASVPDWKFIADKLVDPATESLKYTINRNASTQYNGFAIQVFDKKVYLDWDFQVNKIRYLITGYNSGTIMPVTYTLPSGANESMKILKGLENFNIRPTHYILEGGVNVEPAPLVSPGNQTPGSKPGLEITFAQPKEIDLADWTYKSALSDLSNLTAIIELSDIASSDYLDFNLSLKNIAANNSSLISELPDATGVNNNVVYQYNPATFTYVINIVQDKTTLVNPNNFIQWDTIKGSKIYNATVNFQKEAGFTNYEFTEYLPLSKFAYTYMEFDLSRANMSEAYLDIIPYDAGSNEEVEYTIMYSKTIVADLDPDDDLWVKHYYTKQGVTDRIYIPVPFKQTSSQDVYQIQVTFAGTEIKSQVYNYRAKDDLNVPPSTPKIKEIDNLFVVPSEDPDSEDPSKVQFDLVWTAPENRNTLELDTIFTDADNDPDNDRIFYELLINDVPNDSGANPYSVLKVFEMYKEGNDYKIKKITDDLGNDIPDMGEEIPSEAVNYDAGYNIIDELLRMESVSVFEDNNWAPILETEVDTVNNTYSIGETANPYNFEFPGVNYLRIRAITMIDGNFGVSYLSVPMSLSLSLLRYDLPIPEGLSYDPINGDVNTDPVGLSLYWHSVDLTTYDDHMLGPIGKNIDDDGLSYNVFISQDPAKLLAFDPFAPADPLNPVTEIVMDGPAEVNVPAAALNRFRNNELLYFNMPSAVGMNTMINAEILGLDKNTNYYIRILTRIDISNQDLTDPQVRESNLSAMLSTTTPVIPQKPDDGEVKPLAVENFDAQFLDDSLLSARLMWDFPKEILFEEDKFAFEVIGIEDKALPTILSSSGITLDELIDSDQFTTNPIKLWRVQVENDVAILRKYNPLTEVWDVQDNALLQIGDNHIEIIDESNTPNRVYYYYARTINVGGGTINSASPWIMDVLTTSPIKAPINLAVAYDTNVVYNQKTETVIRFDAPIPEGASLTDDYRMEIYIKGEKDSDYTHTKYTVTYITQNSEAPLGYTRLFYKIQGLESGNAYSVKVRIEDRTVLQETLPDGTLAYPKSAFCERVIIRTEFDQADYDKKIKYQEYLDYFDAKVKDLEVGDYFVIETTATKNVVKYRDSYSKGSLVMSSNKEYALLTTELKTNVFYLPSNFIENMNTQKVTLTIKKANESVMIRPFSLGINITPAIITKANEIKKYDTAAVDYYIKITVDSSESTTKINMKSPASNLIDIKMEIVGSLKYEDEIDFLMADELENIVVWKRDYLEADLAKELDNGIDDKKLLKYAQDAVVDVKNNYRLSGDIVLRNNLESSTTAIAQTAKNFLLSIKPKSTAVGLDAMKKVNTAWQKQSATYFNSLYQVETQDLTTYTLLSQEIYDSGLQNTYSQSELDVIYKYKLTEVFEPSEMVDKTSKLDKYSLIPALAKMLSAPSGSENLTFLKGKGIDITDKNLYEEVARQEILYCFTQVFAKKSNIVLSTSKIKNYNMILDLSSILTTYRQTLLIGANMGMFDLVNQKLLPTEKMTVPDFIKLLTKLDAGLNQ